MMSHNAIDLIRPPLPVPGATNRTGMWQFTVRDPGDYVGRHRVGPDRSSFSWMRSHGNYEPGESR